MFLWFPLVHAGHEEITYLVFGVKISLILQKSNNTAAQVRYLHMIFLLDVNSLSL